MAGGGLLSIFCLEFHYSPCPGIRPKVINCRPANTRDTHWGDYCWNRSNFIGRATYLEAELGAAEEGERLGSPPHSKQTFHPCLLPHFRVKNSQEKDIFINILWQKSKISIPGLWGRHHCLWKVNAPPAAVAAIEIYGHAQSKYLSRQYCKSTQLCSTLYLNF